MSKYTTEVRYICEKANDLEQSAGFADVDEIIAAAIPSVFSFDFPIFDESYRNVICTKILRHYYTREIGFETVGLWKLKLETKLNEVMPFFNQLYQSELIKFNPLYDTDLQTTNAGNKDSETSKQENRSGNNNTDGSTGTISSGKTVDDSSAERSNVNSTNDNGLRYDLYSDTPQGGLTGVDSETYLTNARKITDDKTTNGTALDNEKSSGETQTDANSFTQNSTKNNYDEATVGLDKFTSTENYLIHVIGKQGGSSFSKMLQEFRETFLNIDVEVIDSLSDLFLNLW